MSKIKVTQRKTILPLYGNITIVVEIVNHLGNSPIIKRFSKDENWVVGEYGHVLDWDMIDGISFPHGYKQYMIFARGDLNPGLVAHECLHTMHKICTNLGIKCDPINDEPLAYILQWLVDEVYKTIEKDKASE